MKKNKGALLIAKNNGTVDYVKQAIFSAKRIKKYLDVPVSVITDSVDYLKQLAGEDLFDEIINTEYVPDSSNMRHYFDGTLSNRQLSFKNSGRSKVYNLSPYNETLLLDTDYIISTDKLKNCFDSQYDLMAFNSAHDVSNYRDDFEFRRTSDKGIDFWWATVIFFRKTPFNELFFDFFNFIEENWDHYRDVYQINTPLYRNDYAFSIAVHIVNGFSNGDFVNPLPGKQFYTIDKDVLEGLNKDEMFFLIEKEDYLGEYTPLLIKGQDVHVMNKFSLGRIIDSEEVNE